MKTLAILSDLHIEFTKNRYRGPWPEATYLALCGDIGVGGSARELIEEACSRYEKVFYVAGNHEYYGKLVESVEAHWYSLEDQFPNLVFAGTMPRIVELEDHVVFMGTMWTDLTDTNNALYAEMQMNDYKKIFHKHPEGKKAMLLQGVKVSAQTISAETTTKWHNEFLEELVTLLESTEKKVIVLSHHSPTVKGLNQKHTVGTLNAAYYTDMEILFKYIDLWAFGHTHHRMDKIIEGCRVVSNPRGYIFSGKKELPNLEDKICLLE